MALASTLPVPRCVMELARTGPRDMKADSDWHIPAGTLISAELKPRSYAGSAPSAPVPQAATSPTEVRKTQQTYRSGFRTASQVLEEEFGGGLKDEDLLAAGKSNIRSPIPGRKLKVEKPRR